MIFSILNENLPEIYAGFVPEANQVRRARGPGKYTWCALKASATLALGGKVWVKLAELMPEEVFSSMIAKAAWGGAPSGQEKEELFLKKNDIEYAKRSFFGEYSFSETVGLWLEKGEGEEKNLLSPFISTEGFTFFPAEYLDLLERLRGALRRYEKLPEVSNGLEDLNTGFFRHRSLEESTVFIQKCLKGYLERGEELHRKYLLAINGHARSQATEKRQELRAKTTVLEVLTAEAAEVKKLTGRARKKGVAKLSINWIAYQQDYLARTGGSATKHTFEDLRTAVKSEQEGVNSAFRTLTRTLKTDGLSLNALTVSPNHGNAEVLQELEKGLNELLREVDEAGLYQLPLRLTDAATTPRQLQQLGSLLDKLRNTKRHMNELPMFYERRHFWYAQPAHLRRLLAPLLELPPQDWEAAFSSWYFERCLEREHRPERFYQKPSSHAKEKGMTENILQLKQENITFLPPEAPWPRNAGPEDLFLDFSDTDKPNADQDPRMYSVAPLSDKSAMHLAVSGYRNPVLVFFQPFQLLHPPQWRICKVDAPPAGPEQSVLLQLAEHTPWIPLSEWTGRTTTEINVFLPEVLNAAEEKVLLAGWESLVFCAPVITYFHDLTPNAITQGLLSDGFNGAFITSALLRAAEASETEPFDHEALIAIGREVRLRCGLSDPAPHPLATSFGAVLKGQLPDYFFEHHVPWRDTFLPLVLQSPSGKKTVLLLNGRLPGLASNETENARHQELETAGFRVLGIDALRVWEDLAGEVKRVLLALTEQQ
jgi:hypothetical protein